MTNRTSHNWQTLAVANSKLQQYIERTPILRRSGDLAAWSWAATLSIVIVRIVLGVIVDPARVNNFSPLWLPIAVIAIIFQIALIWALMFMFMLRILKKRLAPFMNLTVVAIAGGLANDLIGVIASEFGLDEWDKWEFRFFSGAIINTGLFLLVNNLVGAYREQAKRVAALQAAEHELLGVRESSRQMLDDEESILEEKTRRLLLPAIAKIEQSLGEQAVIDELRSIIANEVRPMSNEIMQRASKLQNAEYVESQLPVIKTKRLKRFSLRQSLRPWSGFFLLAIAYGFSTYLIVDHRSLVRGTISAFFTVLFIQIVKWLLPKERQISTWLGIIAQALISAVAVIPGYFVFYSEHGPIPSLIPATLVMALESVAATFFLAYARGLDNTRREFTEQLQKFNDALALEVSLFEQRLWLDRRAWSFLLHGTVQSSLTAALLRLQGDDDRETALRLVREDLGRAKQALQSPPARIAIIDDVLRDIEQTWGGICKVTSTMSSAAEQTLRTNNDACMSVNEIAKEAVSNAVRHANAKEIAIVIDKEGEQISLKIENNGLPYPDDVVPGLGSRMINDLTLRWTISAIDGKTVLHAIIPVATQNSLGTTDSMPLIAS